MKTDFKTSRVIDYLASGHVLFHSQMKSGTTFLCHIIAFYNRIMWGAYDERFSNLHTGGVIRATSGRSALDAAFQMSTNDKATTRIIQTHACDIADLNADQYKVTTLLTRDPRDYCVSSYFFHFVNRRDLSSVERQEALYTIILKYLDCHEQQQKLKDSAKVAHILTYERLMKDTEKEVGSLIQKIYGEVKEPVLHLAIKLSAPDRLRAFEENKGKAVIAGKNFTKKHFIRSGKVGEYADFFEPEELAMIETTLRERKYELLR